MNPADENAEITGCDESLPGTREMAADRKVGRHFDYRTSVHEAGHCVAGVLLDMSIEGCSIEFIDGHHGRTWSNGADLEPAASVESICSGLKPLMAGALVDELYQAHCHCIEYLAGVTAEELFCGGELLPNTGHDLQSARAVAGLITREVTDVDAYIEFARTETRALLTAHATKVLAVAAALVERGTLNRSEIYRLITGD
jgi:hypothetical protein